MGKLQLNINRDRYRECGRSQHGDYGGGGGGRGSTYGVGEIGDVSNHDVTVWGRANRNNAQGAHSKLPFIPSTIIQTVGLFIASAGTWYEEGTEKSRGIHRRSAPSKPKITSDQSQKNSLVLLCNVSALLRLALCMECKM